MKHKNYYKNSDDDFKQGVDVINRRQVDRRRGPGKGFTYVSTVGWICRREQARRNDDACDFNCRIDCRKL